VDLTEEKFDQIFEIGIIDQAVNTFFKSSKINKDFVIPNVNYTGNIAKQNQVIEFLTLKIFENSLESAIERLNIKYKNRLSIFFNGKFLLTIESLEITQNLAVFRKKLGANNSLKDKIGTGFIFINRNDEEVSVEDESSITIQDIVGEFDKIKGIILKH
jgi:hypothetical protein